MSEELHESPQKKVKENPSALTQLKEYTVVVADSGKINEIQKYKPQDSTTNPSLILEAVNDPLYGAIVEKALKDGVDYWQQKQSIVLPAKRVPKKKKNDEDPPVEAVHRDQDPFNYATLTLAQQREVVEEVCDHLSVGFGLEILKHIPGYVSTEVDARLSFDKNGSIAKAKHLIDLYEKAGVSRDRILIKLAATWEGIEAAKALKKDKINCNMTLIFNHTQAVACAQAQVRLISPFVGRILDWFKKNKPADYSGLNDPGVQLVTKIWQYFRKFGHQTIVMAASFRTMQETIDLSGCDRMTIPLSILEQLQQSQGTTFPKILNNELIASYEEEKFNVDEKLFRYHVAVDPMANELLNNGIKRFADDIEKLEHIVRSRLE